MKILESRILISNLVQDEDANETLSVLHRTQMPSHSVISLLSSIWILLAWYIIQTSRASSYNLHIPTLVPHFLVAGGLPSTAQVTTTLHEPRTPQKPVCALSQYLRGSQLKSAASPVSVHGCTEICDRGTWAFLDNHHLKVPCCLKQTCLESPDQPLYLMELGCEGAVKAPNRPNDRGTWQLAGFSTVAA